MTKTISFEIEVAGNATIIGTAELRVTEQDSTSDYGNGTATETWTEYEVESATVQTLQTETKETDRDCPNWGGLVRSFDNDAFEMIAGNESDYV